MRHSQHVSLDLVLTVLHKVLKWLQRAVKQAQECTGSRGSLWLPLQRRKSRAGSVSAHQKAHPRHLVCVGHLLRAGKSSEVTPEHKGC